MTNHRPLALVLGANGRFGVAAVSAFAAAGWTVLAQGRRPPAALPHGARALTMDLHDPVALAEAAAGARAVVHAINPPYTRWADEALPLLQCGADVAQRLEATFLLPGNVYNFGAGMPPLLDEQTIQRPTTRKGSIRCAMEGELERRAAHGLRAVVLRAGDFYGGGTGSWFDRVIAASVARGRLVYPGPLDRAHAWAYLPDFARAAVAVASVPRTPGFDVLHFEGHTLTGQQLLDAMERAAWRLGVQPSRGFVRRGLPWPVLRAAALVLPLWREILEMSYLWEVPHALDGRRLAATVGPLPSTPVDVAMVAALRALGHGRQQLARAALAD